MAGPIAPGCGGHRRAYRGTVMTVPYIFVQKSPDSEESGDFVLNLFVPIRRAETSDRSGGFTRQPSSGNYQSRVWLPALPGDRSGGFCSPYGSHNLPVTSLSAATRRRVRGTG